MRGAYIFLSRRKRWGIRGVLFGACTLCRCCEFCQAEIQNFDKSAFRDEDIRGFDIPVDNSLGVRGFQSVGYLEANPNDLIRRHGFALHHHAQRLPFQQFHAYIMSALVLPNFVDGANIGMIQSRSGARFALEALMVGRIAGKIFGQQLQRDLAAQFRVPGAVHHTHPASTKLVQKLIMRKHLDHLASLPMLDFEISSSISQSAPRLKSSKFDLRRFTKKIGKNL